MFSVPQGPTKQTATDAINVFSGRLQSATLLEDRRNAVQGLRSFARQYPASVASSSLRDLISSLGKDVEDVDTVKVVLETLIMLFNPNESSPEASEEIFLWMADEFTQRQDNITVLLDLLEPVDFYSRLYSLQLLNAILAARAERTEECIFTAPLGISRLVAVLDDTRDAIRNEGLSLLTYLTPHSPELQKLVAFENAFDKIFTIIKAEGSLTHGGRVVEDCLILLANLLRMNVSNQSHFRETGCVPKIAQLLDDATSKDEEDGELAEWAEIQRNRNIYALLAVLRLFLVRGGTGLQANQASFWQHRVLLKVLDMAFDHSTDVQIKSEALITCGDIIRGNPNLQAPFSQLQVTAVTYLPSEGDKGQHNGETGKVHVIDGLLDLTLGVSSLQLFDARAAACECLKAYFYNHTQIRLHFLHRAIEGHASGADETVNVLTTLLRPNTGGSAPDPYRSWFASVIFYHLISGDAEAKAMAMRVSEGDASSGEEVVTCIQTITSNLIEGMQRNDDDRVLIGYLMLLCGWLSEDFDAVNDFLGEGSNVQRLAELAAHGDREKALVQGLCTLLLGIVYEFSTKDSPVPRKSLHHILISRIGKDQYVDLLNKLRRHPAVRDFEVIPQKLASAASGSLPEVFFDKVFVDFMKDNFSRFQRAIDRDPGFEIAVISNGIQKGISRDMVDSLRSSLKEKDGALQKAQSDMLSLERQLEQEAADHRKATETATQDFARLRRVNEELQRNHDDSIRQLNDKHEKIRQDLQRQLDHVKRSAENDVERIRKRAEAECVSLRQKVGSLTSELEKATVDHKSSAEKAKQDHASQIQALETRLKQANQVLSVKNDEHKSKAKELQARIEEAAQEMKVAEEQQLLRSRDSDSRLKVLGEKLKKAEQEIKLAKQRAEKAEASLSEKEKQRAAAQTELDDLLMVFGDVEEKAEKYKQRLLDLGESVSDGEDDEEKDAEDDEASDDEAEKSEKQK